MDKLPIADQLIQPIRKPRLATMIADALRDYVARHDLRSGDRLPTEHELASAFAVSRNVVREALRVLEEHGLVETTHGRGTFLRADLPESERAARQSRHDSPIPEGAAAELRSVFEAGLAELIVKRATSEDLAELTAIVGAMKMRVELDLPSGELDVQFHERLLRATHNEEVVRVGRIAVVGVLRDRLTRQKVGALLHPPGKVIPKNHEVVVDAIRRGSVEQLRRLLRRHQYIDDPSEIPVDPSVSTAETDP